MLPTVQNKISWVTYVFLIRQSQQLQIINVASPVPNNKYLRKRKYTISWAT